MKRKRASSTLFLLGPLFISAVGAIAPQRFRQMETNSTVEGNAGFINATNQIMDTIHNNSTETGNGIDFATTAPTASITISAPFITTASPTNTVTTSVSTTTITTAPISISTSSPSASTVGNNLFAGGNEDYNQVTSPPTLAPVVPVTNISSPAVTAVPATTTSAPIVTPLQVTSPPTLAPVVPVTNTSSPAVAVVPAITTSAPSVTSLQVTSPPTITPVVPVTNISSPAVTTVPATTTSAPSVTSLQVTSPPTLAPVVPVTNTSSPAVTAVPTTTPSAPRVISPISTAPPTLKPPVPTPSFIDSTSAPAARSPITLVVPVTTTTSTPVRSPVVAPSYIYVAPSKEQKNQKSNSEKDMPIYEQKFEYGSKTYHHDHYIVDPVTGEPVYNGTHTFKCPKNATELYSDFTPQLDPETGRQANPDADPYGHDPLCHYTPEQLKNGGWVEAEHWDHIYFHEKKPSTAPSVSFSPSLSLSPSFNPTVTQRPSVSHAPTKMPKDLVCKARQPTPAPTVGNGNDGTGDRRGRNMESSDSLVLKRRPQRRKLRGPDCTTGCGVDGTSKDQDKVKDKNGYYDEYGNSGRPKRWYDLPFCDEMPTMSPSPTISPSVSFAPTSHAPSVAPSIAPSLSPTTSPPSSSPTVSQSPSLDPTQSHKPTISQSPSVSVRPTPSPTVSPTASPTGTPTVRATFDPVYKGPLLGRGCALIMAGVADVSDRPASLEVSFVYDVITTVNPDDMKKSGVLEYVENDLWLRVTAQVLNCNINGRRRLQEGPSTNAADSHGIVYLTPDPADEIDENGCVLTGIILKPGQYCARVNSKMTAIMDENYPYSDNEVKTAVMKMSKVELSGDAFVNPDEKVFGTRFVGYLTPQDNTDNPDGVASNVQKLDEDRPLTAYGATFIVLAVVGTIAVVLLMLRKRKRRSKGPMEELGSTCDDLKDDQNDYDASEYDMDFIGKDGSPARKSRGGSNKGTESSYSANQSDYSTNLDAIPAKSRKKKKARTPKTLEVSIPEVTILNGSEEEYVHVVNEAAVVTPDSADDGFHNSEHSTIVSDLRFSEDKLHSARLNSKKSFANTSLASLVVTPSYRPSVSNIPDEYNVGGKTSTVNVHSCISTTCEICKPWKNQNPTFVRSDCLSEVSNPLAANVSMDASLEHSKKRNFLNRKSKRVYKADDTVVL